MDQVARMTTSMKQLWPNLFLYYSNILTTEKERSQTICRVFEEDYTNSQSKKR
jgi:hypothetical protein